MVVLPSLSLLAQTVREWCANARLDFDFLAVCSDESVIDADITVRRASELPFVTTTSAESIASFLRSTAKAKRVLFSTYQSAPRVAEALALSERQLDLLIADEAHRCAGRVDASFSMVLKDGQLPSRRRLFMTATPRYLSGRLKRAAGELDVEVVSMDDEAVFGAVFHRLTFCQAIAQELLSDYRVAIIGVQDEECLKMAQRAALVRHGESQVADARALATQAALLKGMAKYDLKRCVTFHSRVARARSFANTLGEVAASLPADMRPADRLWAGHVSGAMRSASRDALLDRLRNLDGCDRGLLANARCLAEGVDVPALDAVAFIDPRGSQVDIVQAVGRVIRKAADKTQGTVLLPVFMGDRADHEGALRGSAFDPVWRVLKALRAHDDVLADELDALRVELGRGGKAGHPAKVVVDLPVGVGDEFLRAFDMRFVEETTETWYSWFGMLQAFVEREGHARVPVSHVESSQRLGMWAGKQRSAHARGVLTRERAAMLESLPGWSWDPHGDSWARGFAALARFVEREGHARVPDSHIEAGQRLGTWVGVQRRAYKEGGLRSEKAALLEGLPGWSWDPVADQWQCAFAALRRFAEREGHVRMSQSYVESDLMLGVWANTQRQAFSRRKLDPERVALLEDLPGWSWEPFADAWERNFAALEEFARREGHTRVSCSELVSGPELGRWADKQRRARVRGALAAKQVTMLESLPGWSWDPRTTKWDTALELLRRFADREGHTLVPVSHVESGFPLGNWVITRRHEFSRGVLSADRAALLEMLPGWSWDARTDMWTGNLALLECFVEREGHSRVPRSHVEAGKPLGQWVGTQRAWHRSGKLSADRVRLLESLRGWVW